MSDAKTNNTAMLQIDATINPGNRMTTIVKGFKGSESMYRELSKYLKKTCGVGGSIKKENILIQGNHRDKIMKLLIERGFKVKVSGG